MKKDKCIHKSVAIPQATERLETELASFGNRWDNILKELGFGE